MSWDVILMRVPSDIVTIDDFPKDFSSELGPRSEVLPTLANILPELDLTDPAWGILDGEGFSIEFNIGDGDPIETIILHARGSDSAIKAIQQICEYTGWRAIDTGTGDLINFSKNPAAGLRQWRSYRDQTAASLRAEGKEVVTDAVIDGIGVDIIEIPKTEKKRWWQFWRK
jgi:hypothetical protein